MPDALTCNEFGGESIVAFPFRLADRGIQSVPNAVNASLETRGMPNPAFHSDHKKTAGRCEFANALSSARCQLHHGRPSFFKEILSRFVQLVCVHAQRIKLFRAPKAHIRFGWAICSVNE